MEFLTARAVVEASGSVILTKAHADEIDTRFARYLELESVDSWRSFRSGQYDIDLVREVVENRGYDFEELVTLMESCNGLSGEGSKDAERWAALSDLPFDGGPDDEFPADDDPLGFAFGEHGAQMTWDLHLQATMRDDLPTEIFDEFEITVDSTLDGVLGFIRPEDLNEVCDRLRELGYQFDE
jgi:hypothetical protein